MQQKNQENAHEELKQKSQDLKKKSQPYRFTKHPDVFVWKFGELVSEHYGKGNLGPSLTGNF